VPIHEAISVPCVELWFLLHFAYSTAPFANFNAIRTPLRTHIAGYEKADANIAALLVQRHPDAVANARRLVEQSLAEGFDNPYTNFHELVEHIQSLAG
jgi:RloB-like protein